MTKKFYELLNGTFDNGTVHIKYLEQIIRCISSKLDMSEIDVDNVNLCHYSTKNDPIAKLVAPTENLCSDKNENSIVDILSLLNVSKRIEALEISVQKISSVMHKIMINGRIDNNETIIETQQNEPIVLDDESDTSKINSFMSKESIINEIIYDKEFKASEDNKISKLEASLAKHDEILNSLINQNQFVTKSQLCETEKHLECVDEKLKDVFYACELNDEKIDEAILSIDKINLNLTCLKSNVGKLLKDSDDFLKKFNEISETCKNLELLKAEQSYVEDVVLNKFEYITSKLNELSKIGDYEQEEDLIKTKLREFQESFRKYQEDFRVALRFLKSQIDGKLEKNTLKEFKACVKANFDNFLEDLKSILMKYSSKSNALGTSEKLTPELQCISCKSSVYIKTELESNSERHVFNNKQVKKKKLPHQEKNTEVFSCTSKKSLLNFPVTEQCFIISKDNAIFKADPMKCLLNPNYTEKI